MRRTLATIGCCALVLGAAACGATHKPSKHAGGSLVHTSAIVGRPQAAALSLSEGSASARYRITAPSPAMYVFDVAVAAPEATNISVHIHTWYGATLSVLNSTRNPESCRRRGSQISCVERFPRLPAQRAGSWTVVVTKQSGYAAKVHIAVTFMKV